MAKSLPRWALAWEDSRARVFFKGVPMALLWVDGFEGYGDSDVQEVSTTLARRGYSVNSSRLYLHEDGRFNGFSLNPGGDNSAWFRTPALTTDDTFIVCFALKFESTIGTSTFCRMFSVDQVGMQIAVNSDGTFDMYRGGTFMKRSTANPCKAGLWCWVEFKVVCDNSSGSYELRVNGDNILSDSGIDTQVNQSYHDQVQFRGTGDGRFNSPRIDDLFIMDSTGAKHNDFIGQRRVLPIFPSGDTADVDWTASPGPNHYDMVDEQSPDADSTYVESDTTGEEDIWEYDDISGFDSIEALTLMTNVKVSDVTPYDFITVVKSGGTKYDSAAETIGNVDYLIKDRLMTEDPDTSSAWTQNGINNVEMGVEVG